MGLTRISEGSPCFSFPFLHQVTSFFLFFFFTFLFHRWLFPLPHRSERFFSSLCRACSVIESVTRNSNTWENEGKMENKPLPLALPPPETHFERFFLFLKNPQRVVAIRKPPKDAKTKLTKRSKEENVCAATEEVIDGYSLAHTQLLFFFLVH